MTVYQSVVVVAELNLAHRYQLVEMLQTLRNLLAV
jgi:hypothetical protein